MRNTTTRIYDLVDRKKEEIIALQNEKEDLKENMAHPDALEDNKFQIEELERQIRCLNDIRRYASYTENPDTVVVADEMLRTQKNIIEDHISKGNDATESMKAFTSLKIVASEINNDQVDDSQDQSNDQGDDSENVDPTSFDE